MSERPASGGRVEVRRLAAATRAEIRQLAEVFDLYRAHYGEAPDTPRAASWLEGNIRSGRVEIFVAEATMGSSALPSR